MRARELKQARTRLSWTQTELGAALDIHRLAIARYENGTLPVPRLVALAVAYLETQAARTRKTA